MCYLTKTGVSSASILTVPKSVTMCQQSKTRSHPITTLGVTVSHRLCHCVSLAVDLHSFITLLFSFLFPSFFLLVCKVMHCTALLQWILLCVNVLNHPVVLQVQTLACARHSVCLTPSHSGCSGMSLWSSLVKTEQWNMNDTNRRPDDEMFNRWFEENSFVSAHQVQKA